MASQGITRVIPIISEELVNVSPKFNGMDICSKFHNKAELRMPVQNLVPIQSITLVALEEKLRGYQSH